jgi:predicted nucleotidyltransferase
MGKMGPVRLANRRYQFKESHYLGKKGYNMNTDYIEALNKFAAKVRSKYPGAKIRAFGSYVRGTATEESDLDVCVVLKKSGPEDRLAISDIAWDVGFDSGILVSTIVISEDAYENGPISASPLVKTIRSEGVPA